MSESAYDIAIVGGGPGGYAAALRAAELNLKVVVVEKNKIGGTCLHHGCIPTTSLLQCASVLELIKRSDKFGLKVENVSFDWQEVQQAKLASVSRLFMGLNVLFKQRKVEVMGGKAHVSEPGRIKVQTGTESREVRANHIIIATGSMPRTIPALDKSIEAASAQGGSRVGRIMNTSQALEIGHVPQSIAVIGAGAYGVEFASLFRSFGAEVSLIEMGPRIIPRDEAELSKYLQRAFTKRGIKIFTGSSVDNANITESGVDLEVSKDSERQTISAEVVLETVGRVANTNSIDVEGLGITTKGSFIVTDADMKTNVDGIYAVGDVTFNPQYANFAFSEGFHAVETIAGLNPPPLNLKQIPIYKFGNPELAKVGYSEASAKRAGYDVETVSLPFQLVSRSAIEKEEIGFIKMVAVKNGPIIGIHLIGPGVINLIAEAMLITGWEATAADMAQFLHPHPTYTEAIGEAALKLAGKPLHSL